MHVIFMPYGKRSEVELLLRDMEAQKHLLKMKNEEEEKAVWIQGGLRCLPFGVYEYVFPKEDLDKVLTTLECDSVPYKIGKIEMAFLRKALKAEKIPKYDNKEYYLWIKEHVSIIPIGIRKDGEVTGSREYDSGFVHEAL